MDPRYRFRVHEIPPALRPRERLVASGPAGLTCAFELRKMGHQVAVFEAGNVPGGLNTVGIAPYKITADFALTEVELVNR